ncbi:hypothetical protein DFH07DRAFT_383114 [Mycena maculata]|uniref:Uncharacterized protein n=1 Tax=Mycena maculata TaxID=230809 RepID=A0AAD7H6Z5_9AGAR|nr:hypothetical protein DFH07DRAFT_383114 [Mycena maculata]
MYLNTMQHPQHPVRHPWFDKTTKRKQPSSVSDPSYRATKRHRSGTLERGFANLTLDASMPPPVPPSPPLRTPTIPEVTMKASSWYEPERDRIVITDLDSYSDDEADATSQSQDAPLISPALIKRISTRPLAPDALPAQYQTQALVLFRPLSSQIPPPPPEPKPTEAEADDDAMDVEP